MLTTKFLSVNITIASQDTVGKVGRKEGRKDKSRLRKEQAFAFNIKYKHTHTHTWQESGLIGRVSGGEREESDQQDEAWMKR